MLFIKKLITNIWNKKFKSEAMFAFQIFIQHGTFEGAQESMETFRSFLDLNTGYRDFLLEEWLPQEVVKSWYAIHVKTITLSTAVYETSLY